MRASPSAIRVSPTQEGGGGGGAGANGTWTYDSGAAGLTFGAVNAGDTKEIAFTGNADGDVYVSYLRFIGVGAAGFEVSRFTRNGVAEVVDTPQDCAAANEFVLACDDTGPKGSPAGAAFAIQFRAVYTDGTAESMTVEMYDVSGALVDTITASATTSDPVFAAATALSGRIGVWSAQNLAVGTKSDLDPLMEDLSAGAEPDFVYDWQAGGDTISVESGGPGVGSLSKFVRGLIMMSTDGFMIADSALSATVKSGFVIFRLPNGNDYPAFNYQGELFTPDGYRGTPTTVSFPYGATRFGITGPDPTLGLYWQVDSTNIGNFPTNCSPVTPFGIGDTGWYAVAWSVTAGSGAMVYAISSLGGSWGDKANTGYTNSGFALGHAAGFRAGYLARNSSSKHIDRDYCFVALYNDNHTMGEMQGIYNAI